MTLQELEADPTFDRHVSPKQYPDWLAVAAQVNATAPPDIAKFTDSQREAMAIGLRSLDHPDAQEAVKRLAD